MATPQSPVLSLREIQEKLAQAEVPVSTRILNALRRDPRAGARKLYAALAKRADAQRIEKARLERMLHFERLLWKAGLAHIAGVDEVGMGPLAGPVVAAAVVFPPEVGIGGINDSKALDEQQRNALDGSIRAAAVSIGIGIVEVEEIDSLNIYHAGLRAMQRALGNLSVVPQHVLVDARTIPDIEPPQNSFAKGDGLNFSIAAASIVAKVHRDRLMTQLDHAYPGYGFAKHKGYATAEHQSAIRSLGPCPIHRKSFDVIKEVCGQYSSRYYELKLRCRDATDAREMARLEAEMQAQGSVLGELERKRLALLARRAWQRIDRQEK